MLSSENLHFNFCYTSLWYYIISTFGSERSDSISLELIYFVKRCYCRGPQICFTHVSKADKTILKILANFHQAQIVLTF